jgi:hypothetical protein
MVLVGALDVKITNDFLGVCYVFLEEKYFCIYVEREREREKERERVTQDPSPHDSWCAISDTSY